VTILSQDENKAGGVVVCGGGNHHMADMDRGHARLVWSFGGGRGGYFAGSIQGSYEARLQGLHLLTLPLLLQQLVVQDGDPGDGRRNIC
jgi:hypothetical protein